MTDKEIKILAIESSCDETAAAVVVNGRDVRSNVISSQIDLGFCHQKKFVLIYSNCFWIMEHSLLMIWITL